MKIENIDLYEYYGVNKAKKANGKLTLYVQDVANRFDHKRIRPAMIICPGGGYSWLSAREEEPIAVSFLAKGYNVFVLEYSVAPLSYPTQLVEVAMAVSYVKENAKELGVDKEHVAVTGFSAGGHLALSIATLFNDKNVKEILKDKAKTCKPDAVVLAYPVVTSEEFSHFDSIKNVSGGDKKLMEYLSLEKRVNKDSVPAFIWHTKKDDLVPVMNSIVLAEAYAKTGADFELHIFENGVHGLGLATRETAENNKDFKNMDYVASKWIELAEEFLKNRGFKIN